MPLLSGMRRLTAGLLLALALLLAGCAQPTDWTKAQEGEIALTDAYEAMGTKPYPLTAPVIVGCGYWRNPGEEQRRPLTNLVTYNKDPETLEWLTGPQDWSDRMCAAAS